MKKLEKKLRQIKKCMNNDVIFILGMRKNGKTDILSVMSAEKVDKELESLQESGFEDYIG